MLDSNEVSSLKNLIRDSFRVREDHDPIYVDVGGNLVRFASRQQQVLFGRRGSGKSCLQVHFLRTCERDRQNLAIYIGVDEIKRLGFPDVLVRILLSIFNKLPGPQWSFLNLWKSPLRQKIDDLRRILDEPDTSSVSRKHVVEHNESAQVGSNIGKSRLSSAYKRGTETTSTFDSKKLDELERHLQDYKEVLQSSLVEAGVFAYVLVDDFYLVERSLQPHVVDYLHRLLRGTHAYLKLATIRHRTTLRTHEGQTIGVELSQDVEELSLDKTFEDFEATHEYLHAMLQQMGRDPSVEIDTATLFNPDAARALTLSSGGVPRDFLNIFVDAIDASIRSGKFDRITPTYIYKAASSLSYKSKIANLKEEAGFDSEALERLFSDLVLFCLSERRKTVFLVGHDDVRQHPDENELLQQLMDFKLIHLVDANTSAASGRAGRYAAYTLDFSIFMEPRRRGIEIVQFWKTDNQRRPVGVRESPDYPLRRVATVIAAPDRNELEDVLEAIPVEDLPAALDTAPPAANAPAQSNEDARA